MCVKKCKTDKQTKKVKKTQGLARMWLNINRLMDQNGQMRLMNTCYLKIAVFSLLQVTNPSFSSNVNTLSTVLSFLVLVYVFYFPVKILLLIKKGNL